MYYYVARLDSILKKATLAVNKLEMAMQIILHSMIIIIYVTIFLLYFVWAGQKVQQCFICRKATFM